MNSDIKKIMKNSIITSLIVFIYGILVKSQIVYIGAFLGSIISVITLYTIYLDAEVAVRSHSAFKITVTGYLKRYAVYGIYLGILLKYFGTPMCVGGAMGLLNTKFNIALVTIVTSLKRLVAKLDKIK